MRDRPLSEEVFIAKLAADLQERGEQVIPNFRLKSGRRADLYLPALPRGLVEVKIGPGVPDWTAYAQLEGVWQEMADARCYLVMLNETPEPREVHPSNDKFTVVRVNAADGEEHAASEAANRLWLLRQAHRAGWEQLITQSGWGAARNTRKGPWVKKVAEDNEVERTVAGLVASLHDLVDDKFFGVIDLEIEALMREFSHRHYTACALRVGRALEFTAYAVARALEVPIEAVVLDGIQGLQRELDEVNRAILEYADTDPATRQSSRRKVIRRGANLQTLLLELLMSLDEPFRPQQSNAPRNVEAILRSIRSELKQQEVAREAMDRLLKQNGPVRAAQRLRNKAAHADARLSPSEITRREVTGMLENFELVLHELTNAFSAAMELPPRAPQPTSASLAQRRG